MIKKRILARLRERLREFCVQRGANVTVTFALTTVPIVGAVGAAVDYSHVNSARTAMQAAVDATALMLSKDISTLTQAQINTKATSYFIALYTRPEVTNISVTPTYSTTDGTQIVVTASGTVKASFMSLIGISQMQIGASSTVKWGNTRLRVALVLDNTGSMASDNKMTVLKTAAKNLLTQLKTAAVNNGDVYVSIIPFNKDVNVGSSNYSQNWIDWEDWDDDNGHDQTTQTCTTKTGKNGKKTKKCTNTTTWVPDNHNTWNGCITDRDHDYDVKNTAPATATPSTLFPAEQYDNCPVQMMGLTYDWMALNNKIDSMKSVGSTNQGIGLAWGWQSLTAAPFTIPPKDPKYKYQEVIILMSDGLNTENRWNNSAGQIDARQKLLCDNVKAAGITLYTIHVNTDGDPLSTLLKGCASSADKFWMLTSANQMVDTFKQIGTQLSNLRVAK